MLSKISITRDEAGYQSALAEYEAFFDNEPEVGSDGGDRFELLTLPQIRLLSKAWGIPVQALIVEVEPA